VRMGQTRADLDCYTVGIEHTPTSLVMRHRQERTDECQNIRARQQVTLRLPRNVDLKLNAISGPVKIGEDRWLVAAKRDQRQGRGRAGAGLFGDFRHQWRPIDNGPRLSERGMRVSGISGKVELRVASDLNADLNLSGINGDVNAAAPNVTINKVGHSDFRGRVGSGGSVISVSGISGSVTFRSE